MTETVGGPTTDTGESAAERLAKASARIASARGRDRWATCMA